MSKKNSLQVPDIDKATELLAEAADLNPGPWVAHSKNAAKAASNIAGHLLDIDSDAAFSMGLLHDIGRREGKTFIRHTIDGFNYLMRLGYDDAARICLTHSFPIQDVRVSSASWDCTAEEADFMQDFISAVPYSIYDKLIQLCDGISTETGYCLLEKRMVDVGLRHGVNEFTVEKWQARFAVKYEIEQLLGKSIYTLLNGVVEETLGFDPAKGNCEAI